MAGAIAAAWRREDVPLRFSSFVRGVTLHDRGYGELDDDAIGETTDERWAEIQRRGFRASSGDATADLVVALHIRRLIGDDTEHAARAELAQEIDHALGDVDAGARTADRVTELCDTVAFAFCFEQRAAGSAGGVAYAYDGDERVTLDPWPLALPELRGVVVGFVANGYPVRPEPTVALYEIAPLR
jgi:hypothetical protein